MFPDALHMVLLWRKTAVSAAWYQKRRGKLALMSIARALALIVLFAASDTPFCDGV